MKKILLGRLVAFALSVLGPVAPAAAAVPPAAVATVGSAPVTAEALAGAAAKRARPVETVDERRALLDDLVRAKLVVEAARAEGYEKDPAVLAAVEAALASRFKEDRLAPRLAEVAVTDADVAARYEAHRADFAVPARALAAVIRVSVPARADAAAREKARRRAEAARAEALTLPVATRTFGAVAVTYSDHQATRYRGGEIGWLRPDGEGPRGEWGPEVLRALAALEPGAVSPVVEAAGGFYLVKLLERQAAAARPLADLSAELRHRLLQEKRAAVEKAFFDALRVRIPVVVDEAALSAAPLPVPEKPGPPPAMPGKK